MAFNSFSKNLLFKDIIKKIDISLHDIINTMGKKTKLRDACEYSLLSGGKRFRPLIVLLIAKSLGLKRDVLFSSIAVEFFHTASLIADDLPCMDNETLRRDKPVLHKVFGEDISILASYSLISAGYELVYKNAKELEKNLPKATCDNLCVIAIETISKYAGIHGATSGQFLDIYFDKVNLDLIFEIIEKKTISLFEIAFVLGWIFGGGDLNKLDLLKKCSKHFGMAFQIADDIKDYKEDLEKDKKINIAIFLGKEKALVLFEKEIELTKKSLFELKIYSKEIAYLVEKLEKSLLNI